MDIGLIRFLSGEYKLLEHDQTVNVSLTDAWFYYHGSEPAFDPDGTNATGMHVPGPRENERLLLVNRASNPRRSVTRSG